VEGAEGADSARGAADPLLPPRTPARGGARTFGAWLLGAGRNARGAGGRRRLIKTT
jgi:hypothetical protein